MDSQISTGYFDKTGKEIMSNSSGIVIDDWKNKACHVEKSDRFDIWLLISNRGRQHGVWSLEYFAEHFTINN